MGIDTQMYISFPSILGYAVQEKLQIEKGVFSSDVFLSTLGGQYDFRGRPPS